MTRLPGVASTPNTDQPFGDTSALNNLKIDDFLNLMITELQNQDPLNPLENDQLLAQISQIRQVGATDKLTQTLDSVLLGQNVSNATSLIGQEVRALTNDGKNITGIVDRVTINNGVPEIHINASSRAVPSDVEGRLEPGTYRYKVVYQTEEGTYREVELGPVTTTGINGLDTSIALENLPEANGPRQIYRTDATGEGDFNLVNILTDTNANSYIDGASAAEVTNTTLSIPTVRELGTRHFTATLSNVSEINAPPER